MTNLHNKAGQSGIGLALRLGSETVSATLVGLGIGYGLDYWLDTKPWFLIVFLFLGVAAGFRNLYHAVEPNKESDQFKE